MLLDTSSTFVYDKERRQVAGYDDLLLLRPELMAFELNFFPETRRRLNSTSIVPELQRCRLLFNEILGDGLAGRMKWVPTASPSLSRWPKLCSYARCWAEGPFYFRILSAILNVQYQMLKWELLLGKVRSRPS